MERKKSLIREKVVGIIIALRLHSESVKLIAKMLTGYESKNEKLKRLMEKENKVFETTETQNDIDKIS